MYFVEVALRFKTGGKSVAVIVEQVKVQYLSKKEVLFLLHTFAAVDFQGLDDKREPRRPYTPIVISIQLPLNM